MVRLKMEVILLLVLMALTLFSEAQKCCQTLLRSAHTTYLLSSNFHLLKKGSYSYTLPDPSEAACQIQ